MNVNEAHVELTAAISAGRAVRCPCCGRRASRYRRRIHSEMGRFLCLLVKSYLEGNDWTHVEKIQPKNGNYAMLRLWGLAEPNSRRTAGANAHGLWRPTVDGVCFARGAKRTWKYLFLWNGTVIGRSDDTVDIHDVLGTKFNYRELMGG